LSSGGSEIGPEAVLPVTRHSKSRVSIPRRTTPGGHWAVSHAFSYDLDTDGFSVAGYYPTQSIFHRAYGNYLGLCRLGQFMAHQMGLTLQRMTCYVNHPLRDDVVSRELNDLAALVQETLNEQSDNHGR
jgi:hypothetical protein